MRLNTERPVTISQGTNRLGIENDLEPFVEYDLIGFMSDPGTCIKEYASLNHRDHHPFTIRVHPRRSASQFLTTDTCSPSTVNCMKISLFEPNAPNVLNVLNAPNELSGYV